VHQLNKPVVVVRNRTLDTPSCLQFRASTAICAAGCVCGFELGTNAVKYKLREHVLRRVLAQITDGLKGQN
jgi:hypothetical protein